MIGFTVPGDPFGNQFIRIKGGDFDHVRGQVGESDMLINISNIAVICPKSGIITLVNGDMYATREPLDFIESLNLLKFGEGDDTCERNRTACKRRRDRLKSEGMCICCGQAPALEGYTHCEACRDKKNASRRLKTTLAKRLDTSIYAIGLNKRTITPLTNNGVRCVGDIYNLDPNIRMRNFGAKCYHELKCALLAHNFECIEWYKYERHLEKMKNKRSEEVSK